MLNERYSYQYVCGTANLMMLNGLCRYKNKTVRFETHDEDEPYEYKSIPGIFIPRLQKQIQYTSDCDSEDEPIM